MQSLNLKPFTITIPGEYYDSQIYDARLYLWRSDGSILTLDWEQLIENITVPESLNIALQFALQYGDNLYDNLLLQDADIRELIIEKFKKLANIPIEISSSTLNKCKMGEQDNLLPFPHADSAVHYKTVYVGSQSGVSSSSCTNFSRKRLSNTHIKKICDLPVVSLSASNRTLALAGGSEGLFDYYLNQNYSEKHPEPRRITEQHSNFVRWLYPSIFSSSYFNQGLFAEFKLIKKRKSKDTSNTKQNQENLINLPLIFEDETDKKRGSIASIERDENENTNREFTKLVSAKEIFINTLNTESAVFTWGTYDKICLVKEKSIDLVKSSPKAKYEREKFISLGSVDFQKSLGDIVSADSSFFGIILEQEDGLLVMTSSLDYIYLPGEPVNWRVFPKSRNYINQLHVIYEDNLCIHSFNHDFFVNQEDKKIGISFGAK
ncbi:MAG: hypothetical protein MET45_14615 [Nostoc sp. LLA-1]|nr:hypothetical protein [Cyanocohniella sp. LLY]